MVKQKVIQTKMKQKTVAGFKRLTKLLKLKSGVLIYDKTLEIMEKFKDDFPCLIEYELNDQNKMSVAYGIEEKYTQPTYVDSKNRAICRVDEANILI